MGYILNIDFEILLKMEDLRADRIVASSLREANVFLLLKNNISIH
jgi:hypothetical protein